MDYEPYGSSGVMRKLWITFCFIELWSNAPLLYFWYAEAELADNLADSGETSFRALHILSCLGSGETYGPFKSQPSSLKLLRAHQGFKERLRTVRSAWVRGLIDDQSVALICSAALFEEVTSGWAAGIEVLDQAFATVLPAAATSVEGSGGDIRNCRKIAAEGILTCLQDAIDSLEQKQMKKKTKVALLASVASVLLVGVALLRKLRRRRKRLPRAPFVNHAAEREEYINSVLHGSERYCVNQLRMKPIAFHCLCHILTEGEHVHNTIHMPVTEQVFIFLHIIGHNVRFRVMGSQIYKSTETVHRYFKVVLRGILKLYRALIRLRSEDTPQEIRNSRRFYPYFKDCVGAIDGTHVRASVPLEIQGRFRGRKDGTTQNVLAAISFDLKFTYVLAGWEGSAHNSRVLNDAFARPGGFSIPNGKYYLGDAGYGNKNGILSPYRSVRYHLKEFSDHPPENEKELFNLRHSSLRTTIERGFGVLKKRFRVLDNEPFWSFETQVKVVLACCVVHNHIMGVEPHDHIMEAAMNEVESSDPQQETQSRRESIEDSRLWNAKRDEICQAMWSDYIRSGE